MALLFYNNSSILKNTLIFALPQVAAWFLINLITGNKQ